MLPPLAFFCIHVLARFPDQLHHIHRRRIPASPALLDALADTRDACLWAALAQLVHPLPPDLHDFDLPLSHPALPLLQKVSDSPDFTLVTLVTLPNCTHLHDDDIANLRSLHRLVALDLRSCSISSYAITALSRGLVAPSRSGPWGLRLLSLHGCPNIDNDVLSVLPKFPILSAIDLRFTRCTPTAVDARLSSFGFCPSDNNSLFYPAPLSLALYSLERIALTTSDPIPIYPCPPHSVFRIHINELNHHPSRTKKSVQVSSSSTSHSTIRTVSSAEDTVVFIPPLRKQARNEPPPPFKPSVSSTSVSVVPTSSPIDRPTQPNIVSNLCSFYENAPAQSRKNILPLSALAVKFSAGGQLDHLAIARPPPPWKILDSYTPSTSSNPSTTVSYCQSASDGVQNSRRTQPIACWIGQALSSPLKVDRARLHRRSSDAVADMVHQFTSKRLKVENVFALEKMRARVSVKSHNPFTSSIRSVFAENSKNTPDKPRSSVDESSKDTEFDVQLRACCSLPSQTVQQPGTDLAGVPSSKPLKPITSLKPPILPKKLLPSMPLHAPKPRTDLKQTRLSFSREVE